MPYTAVIGVGFAWVAGLSFLAWLITFFCLFLKQRNAPAPLPCFVGDIIKITFAALTFIVAVHLTVVLPNVFAGMWQAIGSVANAIVSLTDAERNHTTKLVEIESNLTQSLEGNLLTLQADIRTLERQLGEKNERIKELNDDLTNALRSISQRLTELQRMGQLDPDQAASVVRQALGSTSSMNISFSLDRGVKVNCFYDRFTGCTIE